MADTKKPTLFERIDSLIEEIKSEITDEEKNKLKNGILDITKRAINPEMYCPDCDQQIMPLPGGGMRCINCGYTITADIPVATPVNSTSPTPKTEIPDAAKKALEQVGQKTPKNPGLAGTIQKLADKARDGGNVVTTHTSDDEAKIKANDPNISSDVNWV